MTRVPAGWTVCTMGDVLQPVEKTGKNEADRVISYVDISSIDNDSNRITAPKRMKLSDAPSRARQKIRSGDVLFATVRPYLRNITRVEPAFDGEIASTGFAVLRAAPGVDPRYLFYKSISHDFVSALTGEQYGVSYPAVKEDQVKEQRLELPPTLEQRRIVEKIEALFDEIDRGIETLRDAERAIGLYRHSLLKSAFDGSLTAGWRATNTHQQESPEGSARFDVPCPSARFPWPSVHVRALLDAPLVNGRSAKDKEGGFPVLRLTALKSGKIDLREAKQGDWTEGEAKSFLVKRDDIFISRGNGSKKLVGIGGRVLDKPMPVAFPDTMIRVRLDTSAVRPDYFVLAWNSPAVRQQIEMAARTTAGIYKINQSHVRGFLLPLPSLAEQSEIVRILEERLEDANALQVEINANLARADALRQSILNRAFAGKLVSQDPDDEAAAVLLERVKAANPPQRRKPVSRKREVTRS